MGGLKKLDGWVRDCLGFLVAWIWIALMATAMTAAIATITFAQTSGTVTESEPAAGGNASPVQDTSGTEDDTSVETDPPVRTATPAEIEVEIQRHINELRREQLDDRETYFDRLLAIFAIVIAIAGIWGFRRFREIETEAKHILEEIKKIRDKSHDIFQGLTAKTAADEPEKANQAVANVRENPTASLTDKAIANALSLQEQGKRNEAIEKWRAIAHIAEGSDNDLAARAWFSVGYLVIDESLEDCISANDRAISLKPDYAEAYMNRGAAKNALRRHEDAIADHDEAIRLKPDLVEAYTNRGSAKQALRRHEDAIADHDEAIRLKPDSAEAYTNRGNAKQALEQHKDAIADYDQAIRLKPGFAVAHSNRGVAKSARGKHEDAIADHDEAIRLKPDDAGAYYNRGNANQALGGHGDAIADYNQAILLKPDFAEAYSNRGEVKAALGLKDEARKDFKTALKLARNADNAILATQTEQSLRDLDDAKGS